MGKSFQGICRGNGYEVDMTELFKVLFQVALKGEPDCGGLWHITISQEKALPDSMKAARYLSDMQMTM